MQYNLFSFEVLVVILLFFALVLLLIILGWVLVLRNRNKDTHQIMISLLQKLKDAIHNMEKE
jgi:hypothetical protein